MTRAQERLDPDDARRPGRHEGARRGSSARSWRRGRRGPSRSTAPTRRGARGLAGERRCARPDPMRSPHRAPRSPPPAASCRCRPPASAGSRCACGRASSSGSWRRPIRPIPRLPPPATAFAAELGDGGASGRDDRRRGARPGPRPADLPRRSRSTAAPARTCSRSRRCRRTYSYSSLRRLRDVPAPVRVRLRLPDAAEPRGAGRRVHVRLDRPRGVRGVHEGASRARRARRAAAHAARTSRRAVPGAAGRRPASATRPPRRATSGASTTLLDNFWDGEVSGLGEALHEELEFELTLETRRRRAAGRHHRLDRPDRPPAVRRHRGHRLQDRPALAARRASTRASSSRSTRSPAATRWASARRSG